MSVKDILAKQEAGFISLHEVLTKMTMIDGASYQEAAKVLYRLMNENQNNLLFVWHTKTDLKGVREASNIEEKDAVNCLKQAAMSGRPEEYDDQIPF